MRAAVALCKPHFSQGTNTIMAATNNVNLQKKAVAALAAQILTGIQKHFPNAAQSLTFGGGSVTLTVPAVVAALQALVDTRASVTTARAAVKAAVATENSKMPAQIVFLRAL